MTTAHARWVIALSLLLALICYAVPMPRAIAWYRPELPAVVLMYWVLALPHTAGVITATLVGVCMAIIEGNTPGATSLGLVVAALILLFTYQRVRQFDILQQSVTVTLLVGVALIIERFLLLSSGGVVAPGYSFLLSLPLTLLCWFPVRAVLRSIRRYYEVR